MLSSLSVPGAMLYVMILYIIFSLIQHFRDPLRHLPGPFIARFSRFWYLFKIYQGDFEQTNLKLHDMYGPVVRIAPNEYSINDVPAAKVIYGHGSNFVKAPWYWAWMPPDPEMASLFSDLNPHRHGIQRRKVASAYSMSSLVGYEQFVDNCSSLLITRFKEMTQSGKTIDLGHWFQCYAFDVIGEITFGRRFGLLDEGQDKENIFGAIESRSYYSTLVGVFPWIHQFLYPRMPSKKGHSFVGNYTRSQVAAREALYLSGDEKLREGPPDFVSKFMAIRRDTSSKMTERDIFTTCQSNIGAGSDTTAITLSAILYNLLQHPWTLKELQAEIDTARKNETISDPITFKEASQLPYLQAVIKEALRLHSATGLPLARLVPSSGANIAGIKFPAGATVGINSWVAHRNATVYGKDAAEWRPQRWLEIERDGRGAEVEKFFFTFGMGSRTCIGKNVSLLEVSKLIPELIQRFDFELDEEPKTNGWKTENLWFVKPKNFFGRVKIRTSKPKL